MCTFALRLLLGRQQGPGQSKQGRCHVPLVLHVCVARARVLATLPGLVLGELTSQVCHFSVSYRVSCWFTVSFVSGNSLACACHTISADPFPSTRSSRWFCMFALLVLECSLLFLNWSAESCHHESDTFPCPYRVTSWFARLFVLVNFLACHA